MVVAHADHARYLADENARGQLPRLLVQPVDRGTAAAVLLAAHWISWRDPVATLALFPSDHFVRNEAEFMGHVLAMAVFVRECPEWAVLLGVAPTEAETEYGWIDPGARVGEVMGDPVRRVRRFVEKPSLDMALAMVERGWLWNTLVLVVRVAQLVEAGWRASHVLSQRLADLEQVADSADEARALQEAYRLVPEANFSRAVLEASPSLLAVSRLPATVSWCDWGTPNLVLRSLRGAKIVPPWLSSAERLDEASA